MSKYTISGILTIIIAIFFIPYFVKVYKESNTTIEKSIYILLLVFIILPIAIYYLDKYNIPSKFGYTENINSKEWLNLLTNYCESILSTLLNTAFLIFITFKQIDATYEDNKQLNIETQRLQNLPPNAGDGELRHRNPSVHDNAARKASLLGCWRCKPGKKH